MDFDIDEEEDPHFAFGDDFEEQMDNFWKDGKPDEADDEAIDMYFDEEDEADNEEDVEIEGLDSLNQEEEEEVDRIIGEEEEAMLAEEVALLQELAEKEGPEKLLLDRLNVDKLINMVSRVRLAWPENLPGYNEEEYSTDPQRSKFRESYYHCTEKEKTALWYAENFRRQFQKNFPKRRALVIAPRNECGCQKLFPTFINPSVLGYPEFLDAVTCSAYLKEFFYPEIMEHPTRYPDKIRSHLTVLKYRKVNAFEFAIVLASFLIGVGYDAYVVDGYASKGVVINDATEDYIEAPDVVEVDPLLTLLAPKKLSKPEESSKLDFLSDLFKVEEEEEEKERPVSPSKYRFKKPQEEPEPPPPEELPENLSEGEGQEDEGEEEEEGDEEETEVPSEVDGDDGIQEDEEEQSQDISGDTKEVDKSKSTTTTVVEDKQSEDTVTSVVPEKKLRINETVMTLASAKSESVSVVEKGSAVPSTAPVPAEEPPAPEADEEVVLVKKRKRPEWPDCPEKYYGMRSHSWVLVRAGTREVETPFFIEPFSGNKMDIEDESFFGVEAVFNNKNFWISLQDPQELYAGELSYNLDDPKQWSKMLVEPEKKKKGNDKKSLFQDDDDDTPKKAELLLDMPMSFTPDPIISQDDYERKYPGGKKTFNYNNAIVELASPYVNDDGLVRKVLKFKGTGRNPEDLEYIEEKFENRKDKLARRKWFREGRVLHEYFHKGRKDALKEHVHISGKNRPSYPRDLYYYANAHPQCVAHRQIIRKGIVEHFEGRDDLLYYRFTSYGGILCEASGLIKKKSAASSAPGDKEPPPPSKSKAKEFLELLKGNTAGMKQRVRRKIIKIVEKYHRDEEKNVVDDIAEKYMLIAIGRMRILYHYGDGNLTRHSLEFFKPKGSNPDTADFHPEDCIEYMDDPHLPLTDVYQRFKLLQQMEADQRVSSVLAAQAEEEVYETVTSRIQEDFTHEIEPDAFAGEQNEAYIKMKEGNMVDDEEEGEEDFTGIDFASPFIERFGLPRNKMEEVLLKKRIMLNAKVRLVKKAHAIKDTYEREAAHLIEKMRWYDRHIDRMTPSQEEDFNHMYKERLFEMHIMEKRLTRHQELASESYYKTLLKVLKHPLLNKFSNLKIPPPPPPIPEMSEEERARLAALAAKLKDCCQFYNVKYNEPKKVEKGAKNKRHTGEGDGDHKDPQEQFLPPPETVAQ